MDPVLKKYKYLARFGIASWIYAFFHFTWTEDVEHLLSWGNHHTVHFIYVVFVVFLMWEIADTVTNYFKKHYSHDLTTWPRLIKLAIVDTLVCMPLVIAASYVSIYYVAPWVGYVCPNPPVQFLQTVVKGEVMVSLVIAIEIIKLYYEVQKNNEHEKAFIQKELLASQFQSLKNQVNPHFLFNSFSVLDSLIHDDPKLASDFLGRLSKMYRYMLDHQDRPLVSLAKEFEILESYLFLLKTRHEDSLSVDIEVDLVAADFYLPTLSLQMLIENAVKHNDFNSEQPLKIRIYNETEDYLVVQNQVNAKKHPVRSTKIGLENIRKRYDFQSERKVLVDQDENQFTVKLPILDKLNWA